MSLIIKVTYPNKKDLPI